MSIHVDDTPDENILIRLPEACDFIQRAIDSGGKIFVHCMMGVSRSATVVCAYRKASCHRFCLYLNRFRYTFTSVMKTQKISAKDAMAYIKSSKCSSKLAI